MDLRLKIFIVSATTKVKQSLLSKLKIKCLEATPTLIGILKQNKLLKRMEILSFSLSMKISQLTSLNLYKIRLKLLHVKLSCHVLEILLN